MRTGTVRASTLRQMESLNMDRAAPELIRIYKEESTLEVWKQDRRGSSRCSTHIRSANFQEILDQNLCRGTIKRPRAFTTSLQIR